MGLFAKIKEWFNPLLAKFKKFIGELFQGALGEAVAAIQDIAKVAVQQVANDPSIITGLLTKDEQDTAKLKAAVQIVSDYAKERGIQAGKNAMEIAVTLAVADFNKES